jgi:hypothetical protein
MKTIFELLNGRLNRKGGAYAVEVEVIGHNLPDYVGGFRKEPDGSLGPYGSEYVFNEPLNLDEAIQLVDKLYKEFYSVGTKLLNQDRAGIHTHINVQNWTVTRLFNFACLYYIFEPIIMRWCGEMREGNHFCLRLSDAEYPVMLLKKCLADRDFNVLNTEDIRYASLNYLSLFKYGSLELRGMRTPHTAYEVEEWLHIVDCLVKASDKYEDPISIVESMSMDGYELFMALIFGDVSENFSDIADKNKMMRQGVWMAQDIAYSFDWDVLKQAKKEKAVNPFRKVYLKDAEKNIRRGALEF